MTPNFQDLPALPGQPDFRLVNCAWMDRERYETEGWHVVGSWETEDGHKRLYWAATLEGLRRYSSLIQERKQQRRNAYEARRETDESWSSHVSSLVERSER